jgi:hypothetical protein
MNIQEKINAVNQKSNPIQRIIVAVGVPIVIIILGFGIMTIIEKNDYDLWHFDPSALGESWWGWLLLILIIGVFEYFWFRDRSASVSGECQSEVPKTKQPIVLSASTLKTFSIIGWICLLGSYAALCNGGEPHNGFLLKSFSDGRVAYGIGGFLGSGFLSVIALVAGIITRNCGSGIPLIIFSGITLLITLFVM